MTRRKVKRQIRHINRHYHTLMGFEFKVTDATINIFGEVTRWHGKIYHNNREINVSWFADGMLYNPQNKRYRSYDLVRIISIK